MHLISNSDLCTVQLIEGTEMEKDDCTTIVLKAHKAGNQGLFNNAAQVLELFKHLSCICRSSLDAGMEP